MTMAKLRIRLKIQCGECLEGYALRLAIANGWHTPLEMLKYMDVEKPAKVLRHQQGLAKSLAELADIPSESLLNTSVNKSVFSNHFEDEHRCFKVTRCQNPSLCFECIRDGKQIIHTDWLMVGFRYCKTHQSSNLDHCSNCNTPLEWSENLFMGLCSGCGEPLKHHTNSNTGPFSHFLESESDKTAFLRDIFLTTQRVLRPFDSYFESYKMPYDVIGWEEIVAEAYKLLTDQETQSAWLTALKDERRAIQQLGVKSVELPYRALKRKLILDWPILNNHPQTLPNIPVRTIKNKLLVTSLKSARREHAKLDSEYYYHVNNEQLEQVIGLDDADALRCLIERNIVKPIRKLHTFPYLIYSLNDILKSLNFTQAVPEHLNYRNYYQLLPLFGLRSSDWLERVFNGHLKYSLSSQAYTVLESITVDQNCLKAQLTDSLFQLSLSEIPMVRFAQILKLTKTEAFKYIEAHHLQIYSKHGEAYTSGKNLLWLLQHYLPIRWFLSMSSYLGFSISKALEADISSTQTDAANYGCIKLNDKNLELIQSNTCSLLKDEMGDLIWMLP